ncbi:MAG: hypothetical protein IJC43_04750, partial [Clostridia bacterium]|nr:hypothetical protein [Clostridia bacterium]
MKRMVWIAAGLLAVGLLLAGCTLQGDPPSPEETDPDGGVQHDNSQDAPKTIESTLIIAFHCDFSAYPMDEADTRLAGRAFQLEATLENGAVKGSYYAHTRYDGEKKTFRASHDFLSALQKVVAKHDLAQHNGLSYRVSGLPEGYGAKLSVTYASGESIHASNNQSCFLSFDAMEALEALFLSQVEPFPAPLDLTVEEALVTEEVGGRVLTIRYPVLTLGYPHWDGSYRGGEGHFALDAALEAYNRGIRMDQEALLKYTLRPTAEQGADGGSADLCSLADVFVTRCDSRVVSFYEALTQRTGLIPEQQYRRACNFDTGTGKTLSFADVFSDPAALPELLAEAFAAADPDLAAADAMADRIAQSIAQNDGVVCFALTKGGVHFFAEKNPLGGPVGIVHAMLSHWDHPELVKAYYRPAAKTWMTRLEYDTDYLLIDGTPLRMSCSLPDAGSAAIEWTVTVNGRTCTELFYGSAPPCRLVQTGSEANLDRRAFLYVEEQAGAVGPDTRIYEVTKGGLTLCGQVDAAVCRDSGCNPEQLLMTCGDGVLSGHAPLIPYGLFRIGEDGLPVPIQEDEFGLQGPTL